MPDKIKDLIEKEGSPESVVSQLLQERIDPQKYLDEFPPETDSFGNDKQKTKALNYMVASLLWEMGEQAKRKGLIDKIYIRHSPKPSPKDTYGSYKLWHQLYIVIDEEYIKAGNQPWIVEVELDNSKEYSLGEQKVSEVRIKGPLKKDKKQETTIAVNQKTMSLEQAMDWALNKGLPKAKKKIE